MTQSPKLIWNRLQTLTEIAFSKLQIGQSDPKEKPLEVTKSLIPPPPPVTEAPEEAEEVTENNNERGAIRRQRRGFRGKNKSMNYMTKYMWVSSAREKRMIQTLNGSTYTCFG